MHGHSHSARAASPHPEHTASRREVRVGADGVRSSTPPRPPHFGKSGWDHVREWGCLPPRPHKTTPTNQVNVEEGGTQDPESCNPNGSTGGVAHPCRWVTQQRGGGGGGEEGKGDGGGAGGTPSEWSSSNSALTQRCPPVQPSLLLGEGGGTALCPAAPAPHILLRGWGGTAPTWPPQSSMLRGVRNPHS